MTNTLGEEVKERRRRLGLDQQDLANLAGVSTSFVYFVEHHKKTVRLDKLEKVLEALGLELVVKLRST